MWTERTEYFANPALAQYPHYAQNACRGILSVFELITTLSNLGTTGAVEVESRNEDLDCNPNSCSAERVG